MLGPPAAQWQRVPRPEDFRTTLPDAAFWQIIDAARGEAAAAKKKDRRADAMQMHIDGMIRRLAERTPDEILAFDERYRRYVAQAYRWDLWGAIYWLGGGCSDGGFWNARCLLVSLGQERLARILNNPDELADLASEPGVFNRQSDWQSEGFQYVATKAYQKKTGHLPPWGENSPPDKPAGEPFDFQDRELMQRRFPRIVAKYPEMGD